MDTPNVRDDEVVIDNHVVLLGNDDDDVVLEPTPGNDDDGVSGNDDDGVSDPTSGNDDDGVSEPTPGNDDDVVSKPTPGICNRAIDDSVKRQLDINDKAGIGMAKSFNALVVEAGGFEKLPFIEKDARNYIDKARHLILGKEGADALRGYFERMQYKNDRFYSSMDLDDEGRLKNVFWADACSRATYDYFGDVVTFDTTYLTKRYGMPFAPFVGVNHHGQSILLGAGLISSENTETFVWLFDTWLKCMDDRAPKAIITDQDRAMKNAIAIVFPNTRHRYYLWHIMRKLPEKLGSHAEFKCGLKSALQKCVYDSQTYDEFEKSWEVFIDTYNLKENTWFQSLYSERMYWVPIYLKNTFWAGMSTTQRSESMNVFFASTHASIDAETESSKKVLSPRVVRGKGRPPSKRRQPTIEMFQTKNKKAGGKRQRKNPPSRMEDVLNPTESVILHDTPEAVVSQLPGELRMSWSSR
ncbi:protein FAR1-RELATED SEQUENCE 5-like [Juglans microcarpa x Juglans regia]|uniref:protein FAR1-RELATED SEQUENCE 5-like n=1 Tax=Juglans microcarpa x Juglans regia TaxID=2249226 RepID=UPI001B7EF6BC|nr:protein FAR1-RELATED SEQUENCE 5-like [Juglans microcarpa x Juglans regia]